MLSHIATDLHQVYLEEVFTPQLGKPGASTPAKPKSSSDIDGDGNVDSFEKKVRQLIYDIRHIMRRDKITADQAFNVKVSTVKKYGSDVIKAAKEKLGIKGRSVTSVSEESSTRMVKVTINYKNGTIDRRNVPYEEVSQLRSKPTISSVEISSNKVSYSAGERSGKKVDQDGDGDKDFADVMSARMQASGMPRNVANNKVSNKSYNKRPVREGFSNWRQDLKEVIGVDDEIASRKEKQIKENPKLDNHKDKIVVINPTFNEKNDILGGTILEAFELNEEYLNESVDIATEFFYNCGLNENGVDIVIEELGEEKFVEFVFELSEEYFLSEALTGKKKSPATGKKLGISRKAAPKKHTEARIKAQGGTQTQMQSSNRSGTIKKKDIGKAITASKVADATIKAKKEQESSSEKSRPAGQERIRKTVNDTISRVTSPEARKTATKTAGNLAKGALDTVARAGLSAWKGHQAAMKKKKEGASTSQQLGSGARTALGSFFTKGNKQFKEWVEYLINEGYDLSDWTTEELYEEYGYLCEEAESEQQQKLFGLALSVKRGETSRSEASPEVLKIVDSMSEKKIRDFAKTPHSEVPKKKVNEAIARVRKNRKPTQTETKQRETAKLRIGIGEDMTPTTPSQISAQKKVIEAQKLLAMANKNTLKKSPQQNTSNEVDKTSTSSKMSLESFVSFSSKTGKRTIKPGNPPGPNIEKKPGDYDYTHTPEQQAAMKKQPPTDRRPRRGESD